MKFRTNELTNKQMIVSIQRSPHSFRSRVIVHRTRPRLGLFKFALVVFGCNIDKMSHIAFMEVDENSDGQGLRLGISVLFCQTHMWVDTSLDGWLAVLFRGENKKIVCYPSFVPPNDIPLCG